MSRSIENSALYAKQITKITVFRWTVKSSYELQVNLYYVRTPKSILIKPQHERIEFGYTKIQRYGHGPLPTIIEINLDCLITSEINDCTAVLSSEFPQSLYKLPCTKFQKTAYDGIWNL